MIIGRFDKIDLPEFDITDVRCKIDTGADTSSIHCHRVRIVEKNGKAKLAFKLLDPQHKSYADITFLTSDFWEKSVKSSSGHSEYRYFIKSKIVLYNVLFNVVFTLANRSEMKYPILLGRQFLRENKILVDVNKINLSYKQKKRQK